MTNNIKVIGFDADDTLWVNENYFREAEEEFGLLLEDFLSKDEVMKKLYDVEMENLEIYGFGIKPFTLSMVETAAHVCADNLDYNIISRVIKIGQEMLNKPVILLDQVEKILQHLQDKYRLILVTKGDLLDQHRKLEKSGLEKYFHHIEVMNTKSEKDYQRLVRHLDIPAHQFLMIGNSLKSDILPVLGIGSRAIYVPYEITWQHEQMRAEEMENNDFIQVEALHEVLEYL